MIQYLYLGRIAYDEALALQREMVELRHKGLVENVLLLLEHPPVLTLGRNSDRRNILATDEMLARKGVAVHEINRGGDVTYHGPGQLVGYPIFDLRTLSNGKGGRLGPVDYVRRMEEALIRLCAEYGVLTGRVAGRAGVWTTAWSGPLGNGNAPCEKKVGAIGVHVSRGITSHGFALNVTTDLRDFEWIVPCGIADRQVTSLELETPRPEELPSLEHVADAAARQFGVVFEEPVLAVESLAALRFSAAEKQRATERPDTEPGIEQIGVPMRVPKEIEQLRNGVLNRDTPFSGKSVDA